MKTVLKLPLSTKTIEKILHALRHFLAENKSIIIPLTAMQRSKSGRTNRSKSMSEKLIDLIIDITRYNYPTAIRRIQVMPKTSTNIMWDLYSRGLARNPPDITIWHVGK